MVPGLYLRPELLEHEKEFDEIAGPGAGEIGRDVLSELRLPDLLKASDIVVAQLHGADDIQWRRRRLESKVFRPRRSGATRDYKERYPR